MTKFTATIKKIEINNSDHCRIILEDISLPDNALSDLFTFKPGEMVNIEINQLQNETAIKEIIKRKGVL